MSKIHFLYLWASLIGPPASPPISAEDTVLAERPWLGLDIPSGSKGRHPGLNELLCVRMSYLKKKKKKMPVGGETSQLSHTLKKKKKKKKKVVVGGQVTQFRL